MRKRIMPMALVVVALLSVWWLAGCERSREAPVAAPQTETIAPDPADRTMEEAAIRQALHQHVDRSDGSGELDLELAQVSIDSGWALVSWMHEEQGGQAVLRKEGGAWNVMECGPGWMGLEGVCREKVPVEVAKRLLDQIDPNWASYETF